MDISLATRQINVAANDRMRNQLANSEYMKDELSSLLNYLFSDKIAYCQLEEYSNGFYLGEITNGQRHGFGAYLFYEEASPNALYIGDWANNTKNGVGFYLMTDGACYYGGFVDGEFEGNNSCMVSGNGSVEFEADFHNGDIKRVLRSNCSFTYKGKSYGHSNNGNSRAVSSGDSGCSGCFGLIIVVALILGVFKYCGSCSVGVDNSSYSSSQENFTTYICTARKSLKIRKSPNINANVIGSLTNGESIQVLEVVDGFAKFRYNGGFGYASMKFLKKGDNIE